MSEKKGQIAVLGAGTMGRGIVQVFAVAGYSVRMFDVSSAAIESATRQIHKMLDRAVEKGRLEADVTVSCVSIVVSPTAIRIPNVCIAAPV